jgi:hypothetical protein
VCQGSREETLGLLVNSETRHREELQPNLLETQETFIMNTHNT